ncbi:MAG: ABC transporter ATP-binding protein [Bacteroidales bacterium]
MLITVEKLSKSFGNAEEGNLQVVLKDLDFSMEEGDSVAILGPSGSGKTTFLNILGTLESPDSGIVKFKNQNLLALSNNELDNFRNREIGFVFQLHHLLPQCTLLENVLIPTLAINSMEEKKKKFSEAEELLKRVGIWEHRDKLPSKLSGGECQRVALTRAMINKPSLLLADEPTGALDRKNAEIISDLLVELNEKDGISILMVTHSEKLASRMNKMYRLDEGNINAIKS